MLVGPKPVAAQGCWRCKSEARATAVAISMTALLIADTAFVYLAPTGQYATGALLDAGWVVCWLMLVLHPPPRSTG